MQVLVGHLAQLAVDDRQQLIKRPLVTIAPMTEQLRYIMFFNGHLAKCSGANEYPTGRGGGQHCTREGFASKVIRGGSRLTHRRRAATVYRYAIASNHHAKSEMLSILL